MVLISFVRWLLPRLTLVFSLKILTTGTYAATPSILSSTLSTTSLTGPQSTACGIIANSEDQTFDAIIAYNCLTSVPFNTSVAQEFVRYYKDTIQFQSNLAYLKNPPASYQQPATDLVQGLEQISKSILDGEFHNQYEFEAALQTLIYSAHDAHLNLDAGLLSAFTFGSPYSIASVSLDGLQVPRVYITDDLLQAQAGGLIWQPSPITTINDQNVTNFLLQCAARNAADNLEPHADWNQLMSNAASSIQDQMSIFDAEITFYPGENITIVLENGTQLGPKPWNAFYYSAGSAAPLVTPSDFYNFFVLGLSPNSSTDFSNASQSIPATPSSPLTSALYAATSASSTALTSPQWPYSAYPQYPDVWQAESEDSAIPNGYFLHNIATAVLSIPSFSVSSKATRSFSNTIGDFVSQSKRARMDKVLIDLQGNLGGETFLAIDAFKHFFPGIEPYGGSRMRAHPTADVLGNTFTKYYSTTLNASSYDNLTVNEWVATSLLSAEDGQNFTSWEDFYGPHNYNGDGFTSVQRYNLSSYIFDEISLGGFVVYGYDDRPAPSLSPPYAAEDIVILTDGLCSSACSLFIEMMSHQAGVRTVVAGGRPVTGAMQAASGTRGAQVYDTSRLDDDIQRAIGINSSTSNYLPNRTEAFLVDYASFNIRDQIRMNESTPLQFLYEAADCRIFYTPSTFSNYTNLWIYAANATWWTPQLCVEGSTGRASNINTTAINVFPGSLVNTSVNQNLSAISSEDPHIQTTSTDLEFDTVHNRACETYNSVGNECYNKEHNGTDHSKCKGGTGCFQFNFCGPSHHWYCAIKCDEREYPECCNSHDYCPPPITCRNEDGSKLYEISIDTFANVDTSSCPGAEEDSASQPKDNRDMALGDHIMAGLTPSGP